MASTFVRRLEGKVALITGAATGIGEKAARLFSRHGAKVVIADTQDNLAQKVCGELDDASSALFVHCDVTKESDVKNAVDTAVSKFGKLDIMYNNAGFTGPFQASILDEEISDFERVIGVNLVGPFLGAKHAARAMIPNRCGSIINTASVGSVIGGIAMHGYVSSKHGVLGLTRNTAVDLGRYGIRVNCVSPYIVTTALTKDLFEVTGNDLGKAYSTFRTEKLTGEDVAEVALFLASDESRYLNGENIIVDGGFTIVNSNFCIYK